MKMTRIVVTLLMTLSMVMAFAQDTYTLGKESKLTIDGTSTVHDWTVTANTISGTVTVEESAPKELTFEVAVADIKSERGATMDKKMHAALQRDTHPKVRFSLKELKKEGMLSGTLAIAGHEEDVEIATTTNFSEDSIAIVGEHRIALKDFQIEPPTAMFGQVIVGDEVTVKFDLVFEKE